jgi:hypothetical protein
MPGLQSTTSATPVCLTRSALSLSIKPPKASVFLPTPECQMRADLLKRKLVALELRDEQGRTCLVCGLEPMTTSGGKATQDPCWAFVTIRN